MRPTVYLFDIDGTLVSAGAAGRRSIERAFAEHCGTRGLFEGFAFNGMTDLGIVRWGLETSGHPVEQARVDAIVASYLEALADEMPRSPGFMVHPGVERVLDALAANDGVAVGLGTGNLREGARLKLERASLFHRFGFGGFGCDHEDRVEVIRIGAERGAAQLGRSLADCRVVVVGDTLRDVAAAQAIGAETIGVGTGGCAPADLVAAGARRAFRNLEEPGVVDALRGA